VDQGVRALVETVRSVARDYELFYGQGTALPHYAIGFSLVLGALGIAFTVAEMGEAL